MHVPEGAEGGYEARRDLAIAKATFEAMRAGESIIFQGVLRDAESRIYGAPDLLVRADVLRELFPGDLSVEAAEVEAPDLPGLGTHYRIVDTKFSQLHLAAGGELGNSGSAPAYKVQLHLYNRMLGRLQGYTPPESFVLGRGWEQTRSKVTTRVHDCMDRLGAVAQDYASRSGGRVEDQANAAVEWIRRLRVEGHEWEAAPEPTVDELRVNAKGRSPAVVDRGQADLGRDGGPHSALLDWRREATSGQRRRSPPLDRSSSHCGVRRCGRRHHGTATASAARYQP